MSPISPINQNDIRQPPTLPVTPVMPGDAPTPSALTEELAAEGAGSTEFVRKAVPWLYGLVGVSYILLGVGIFVTGAASIIGVIAAGSVGQSGYHMKVKPLAILGYTALALNGVTAIIYVIIADLHQ